jgi:menaquinone-dependent protoporphyrinogen oxidase
MPTEDRKMKTLVTVASRHGATEEIGRAIADELHSAGLAVDFVPPERVESLDEYEAVVVGSALYMGRWLAPARDFVEGHVDELKQRAVWIFGSGPVTPIKDEGDAAEGQRLLELVGARDNRVFAGQLKKEGLSFVERTVVRMIHSPWGDYRPWPAIAEWTQGIAAVLKEQPVAAG